MRYREKSGDYKEKIDPESGDIVKLVTRGTETMRLSNLAEFQAYPFEILTFTMKVELSEFELGD